MVKYVKNSLKVFLWILYFLSGFFPRCKDVCVFGTSGPGFNDNAKHLFVSLNETNKYKKYVWITSDNKTLAYLRSVGYLCYAKFSIGGIYYCLRSGIYIYNSYVSDINFWLSRNAMYVNLWHGVPLKKIEFDIRVGPLVTRYNPKNKIDKIFNKIFYPHIYNKIDILLVPSEKLLPIFSSAFKVKIENCHISKYPRSEIIIKEKRDIFKILKKLNEIATIDLLEKIENKDNRFLYVPTWRDSGTNIIESAGLVFEEIDALMGRLNSVFIIKFHPNTKIDLTYLKDFPNIRLLDNVMDIYPILPFVDFLITDYSSIYVDFLLIDKEIIFFPFDKEDYLTNNREMYFNYDEVTPGKKVLNYEELITALQHCDEINFSLERERVFDMFYDKKMIDMSPEIINIVRNL